MNSVLNQVCRTASYLLAFFFFFVCVCVSLSQNHLEHRIFFIWNLSLNMECGKYYDMSKFLKPRILLQYILDIHVCLKQKKIFFSYHVLITYFRILC